jgi:hypothetical protein
VLQTLPTQLERNGDFYDPLTIRANPAFDATKAVSLTSLQYLRTPFAGNLVPHPERRSVL